jgi:hypothetical protein
MSDEFRRKTEEGWQKAKEAKAKRRAENREKWSRRRDWSSEEEHKIAVDIEDTPGSSDEHVSASLRQMRAIMGDSTVALFRRLDAAEVLLSYELGPGAAVGVDPELIASTSYRFLKAVVEDSSTPEALRFRALKSIVAVENARAQAKSSAVTNAEKRELLLRLVNAERVRALRASGNWPEAVKGGDQWALKRSDDFSWPDGWPGDWPWPCKTFSTALEQVHDVTTFREQLRSVRARNRADDWELFFGPTHQI